MADAANPQLAAAVSGWRARGAGIRRADGGRAREQAAEVRSATEAPFNLNFFCHAPTEPTAELAERARERVAPLYAERGLGEPPEPNDDDPTRFDGARLEAVLEIRPALASFQFGLPDETAVARDSRLGDPRGRHGDHRLRGRPPEELGADAVIAQGAEAGGHRAAWRRRRDRPGRRGRRPSGQLPVSGDDGPVGTLAWSHNSSTRSPCRWWRPAGSPTAGARGGAWDAGGCDHDHARLLGPARARGSQPRERGARRRSCSVPAAPRGRGGRALVSDAERRLAELSPRA